MHMMKNLRKSIAVIAAALGLTAAALPASAAEPVVTYDFTTEAGLRAGDVQLENYQFVSEKKDGETGQLSLKPYKLDSVVKPDQLNGTVTMPFRGGAGWYTLSIGYQDEPDGVSQFELRVNGEPRHRWTADSVFVTYVRQERVPHVRLEPGDELQIFGNVNSTEFARLRKLEVLTGEPPTEQPSVEVPQRDYSLDLVRLGDVADYPDPDRLIPGRSGVWGKSRETVYYFIAEEPGTFSAYVAPPSRTQVARGTYSLARVTPDATGPREKLPEAGSYDGRVDGEPALLEHAIDEPGLYELHLEGAFTVSSHALTRRIGSHATGGGFFFVPNDTSAIRLTGRVNGRRVTSAAVKNPEGRIVWQGEIADDGERVIPVPAAHQGQPWYVEYSGVGGTTFEIEGVPPYLALHRADLLLPKEVTDGLSAGTSASSGKASQRQRPELSDEARQDDAEALDLIVDGQPMSVIVADAGRTEPIGEAASLLQRYLKKISGAQVPIVSSIDEVPDGRVAILLGTADAQDDLQLPEGWDELNNGGILLRTAASSGSGNTDRLYVLGKTEAAVQQAAATLLHKLGCRFFYPPVAWHVIPEADTVTVALDTIDEPSFIRRTMNGRIEQGPDAAEWRLVNRMGSTINGRIQHSYGRFVPRSLFKTNPEYFATRDTDKDGIGDELVPNQPCTTHPDVVEMFKQGAVQAFRDEPSLELLSVSPNDNTYNMCRCERCREVGSYSDTMWLLGHQAAEAVDEHFDDKLIAIMAYGRPSPPPTLDVERDERLLAELATQFRNDVSIEEMLKGWPEYVGITTIYDYWAIGPWGSSNPAGHYQIHEARDDIPMYHRLGAQGLNGEGGKAWITTGPAMYLSSRLLWDVDADADAVLKDYYQQAFGKGAEHVVSYEQRWQDKAEINSESLIQSLTDLKRALEASDNLDEQRRVASLILYMHAVKLVQDFDEADSENTSDEAARMIEEGDSFFWRFSHLDVYPMNNNVYRAYQHGFPFFTLEDVREILEQDLRELRARS